MNEEKVVRAHRIYIVCGADRTNMAGQAENRLDVGGGGRKGVEVHVSQVLVIQTLTVPAVLLCRIALHGL